MRASVFNNPLFGEGLANLVGNFIGSPKGVAEAELLAAQARNENLTADYREGMDVGLEGDLASMMVRALQAGSDYSRYAPTISGAIRADQRGILGTGKGGMGGGSGGRSGGSKKKGDPASLSTSLRTTLRQQFDENPDVYGAAIEEIAGGLADGSFATEDEGLAWVLQNLQREETVTNPAGTAVTRFLGITPADAPPDEVKVGDVTGIKPRPGSEDAQAIEILNDAREAIAQGADPAAVKERLAGLGIDPARL